MAAPATKNPRKKLTLGEQKEFDGREKRILDAEAVVQKWHKEMESPAVMADHKRLAEVFEKMHAAQEAVAGLYARWEELEAKVGSIG